MARRRSNNLKLRPYTRGLGAVAVLIILFVLGLVNPELRDKLLQKDDAPLPASGSKQSPLREGVWAVVHIADGDTLDVQDDEGSKHRIRLIGANTPEVVKPNSPVEPFGPEASAFTKKVIADNGSRVRIAFDGDQIDRYGRNLAMVYLQTADGEILLNELLIRQGLAKAELQYRFSKGMKERFRVAEDAAKAEKRNMWSQP